MNLNKNYIKKQIHLNKRKVSPFLDSPQFKKLSQTSINEQVVDETLLVANKDIFINVFLTKTYEIFDYVDVERDEKVYEIDRQLINPYYINFGFFESIDRIKVNTKQDLTPTMKSYLHATYSETISAYNNVEEWFDNVGYSILVNEVATKIDVVTGKKTKENGLEKLDKVKLSLKGLVSKCHYFPIDINK